MSTVSHKIEYLQQLKSILNSTNPSFEETKRIAENNNQWFTQDAIDTAVKAIVHSFLDKAALEQWSNTYSFENETIKTIGVTCAGNIPLVGFHDFLCVYLSPHKGKFKLSSKDRILMQYMISTLATIDPELNSRIEIGDLLKNCDAYIATGSNNTARYFEQYFSKYPHIIRKNRTSVAILTGNETDEELSALASDIFTYYGLGCRNVTQLYLPKGYDFEKFWQAVVPFKEMIHHHKYRNNYDYYLAIYLLNKVPYLTNESLLLVENEMPFSAVSVLHYRYYTDQATLLNELQQNDAIQCIVSNKTIPFGMAQHPKLSDYADGVDTMQFLTQL
jgi:hypothetical protein